MKTIFFALCVLAIALLAPVAVYGAQTSRTLQPGNVYEFTGLDARVISHVNVSGAGRYDIVTWNTQGEITRFGTGTGRFSVSGTGGVAITPAAPMSVTFDSSRIRLRSQSGSALQHTRIPAGQSVSVSNNNDENLHIRTSQASRFDYTMFNRAGHSTDFARDVRLPQISIPAGGSITITALRETSVYFPSRLADYISIETAVQPAVYVIELLTGQVYTLANTGNASRTMRATPPLADSSFLFEYITRGRDGHVTGYGERYTNQIQLGGRQSITITPLIDGELFFPGAWLTYINVGYGIISPKYQLLQSGRSLVITNTDTRHAHSVFIRCPQEENGFKIEYVTLLVDEVTFNIVEISPGNTKTLTLQAGAETTITILESETPLALSFPDIDEITSAPVVSGALVRHMLQPGQSVYITFDGEEPVRLLPVADEQNSDATLDYVRYYEDEIDSFGTMRLGSSITFTEGQSALITNSSDEDITFRIPRFYLDNGLTLQESESPALFRLSVTRPMQINNIDRHYNHSFSVQNETTRNVRQGAIVLGYVIYSTGTNIVDFGQHTLGNVEIPANQRMVIGPVPNSIVPSVIFPAEWYGVYFSTATAQEAPLHRITLRPERRLTITNDTRNSFVIDNNAATSAAGYIFGRPVSRQEIIPLSGSIDIPARSEVVITATSGADLELWMPTRWARQLRFVIR